MRTRKQMAELAEKKQQERNNSQKPTKKQIMEQKAKQAQKKKGNAVAAKRMKTQVSVEVKEVKTSNTRQTRVSVKAMKKEKQIRVKETPPKEKTKGRGKSKEDAKLDDKAKKAADKEKQQQNKKQQQAKKQQTKKRGRSTSVGQNILSDESQQKPKNKSQPKQKVKQIIMKGRVPIDDYFPLNKADYHVHQYAGKVYSATLNQTNVQNNNNKFYMIQVIQSDTNPDNCYLFTRWGRVGVAGQNSNQGPMRPMAAVIEYERKYYEKARKGGYQEISMNYTNEDEEEKKKEEKKADNTEKREEKQSKLPKPVQSLVELIFDINMMKQQMVRIGYNVNKMPLGKLSKEAIKKGYKILQELYEQLKGRKRRPIIVALTNDFYSNIPHDFGFSNMSLHILDTEEKVKSKIEMIQSLEQIKVATTLLQSAQSDQSKIDQNYSKLNRNIHPVDRATTQFKTIDDYLHTTHGRHHNSYQLQIVDLFRVQSEMQDVRYTNHIHNKKLLWHGSRLTNFVGILSQGLRIAPPQAPVTGYMFGKGVYFADMSSKSANYCFTNRDNPIGILLLCEVALGEMNEKIHADYYAANLPPGKMSTKGVGKIQPDPKNAVELQKGVQIPMGPGIQSTDPNIYLRYNEFIVYDINQVKIKYILRLKFNYNNNGIFGF